MTNSTLIVGSIRTRCLRSVKHPHGCGITQKHTQTFKWAMREQLIYLQRQYCCVNSGYCWRRWNITGRARRGWIAFFSLMWEQPNSTSALGVQQVLWKQILQCVFVNFCFALSWKLYQYLFKTTLVWILHTPWNKLLTKKIQQDFWLEFTLQCIQKWCFLLHENPNEHNLLLLKCASGNDRPRQDSSNQKGKEKRSERWISSWLLVHTKPISYIFNLIKILEFWDCYSSKYDGSIIKLTFAQ